MQLPGFDQAEGQPEADVGGRITEMVERLINSGQHGDQPIFLTVTPRHSSPRLNLAAGAWDGLPVQQRKVRCTSASSTVTTEVPLPPLHEAIAAVLVALVPGVRVTEYLHLDLELPRVHMQIADSVQSSAGLLIL